MKKKLIAVLLTLSMVAGMLTGCGSAKSESASGKELTDFDVIIDWYPNSSQAYLYVALEKGYFEEEGLNVTLTVPANATDPATLPAAGKANLGIYYTRDVIQAVAEEHVPIKSIGGIVHGPLAVIGALEETGLQTPADWAGKKIGYPGIASSEAIIRTMAESCGVTEDQYELINVGYDLNSSVTTKAVDAVDTLWVNHNILEMEKQGYKCTYWNYADYGVPEQYDLIFVAGDEKLKSNRENYVKFLRAAKKGFEDMKADPDGALEILMNSQDEENYALDEDVEKESITYLISIMDSADQPFLSMEDSVWEDNIKFMKDAGLITNEPAVADMVDKVYEEIE